jgi:hypothetical protein
MMYMREILPIKYCSENLITSSLVSMEVSKNTFKFPNP